MNQMDLMDNLLSEWPGSLDIFGSVWLEALGVSKAAGDWCVCLNLVEHLCLDLMSQMDILLEHRAVCFNMLGPLYTDNQYVWMFLYN